MTLRALIKARRAIANIPNMIRRKKRFRWTKALYRERNHVERFFNKLKFRPRSAFECETDCL